MKNTRYKITLFVVLILLVSGVGQAKAQGAYLSTSLTLASQDCYSGAACIQVTSSGVTINGGGSYVDCHGVAGSVGIDIGGLSNVTVRNLEVRNCEIGIRIIGGGDHDLSQINVHDSVSYGTFGLLTGAGIGIQNSSGNRVNASSLVNNDGPGISLLTAANNTFNNTAVTNNGVGYRVWYSSDNNLINSNDISNNEDESIDMYASNGNTIRNNTINNLGGDVPADGILIFDGTNNVIRGNTVNAGYVGIEMLASAPGTNANNTIENNTALGNSVFDMVDSLDIPGFPPLAACSTNSWSHNNFGTDNEGDGPSAGCIQ